MLLLLGEEKNAYKGAPAKIKMSRNEVCTGDS